MYHTMRVNGSNSGVPPTNPYHISRAYGLRGTGGSAATGPTTASSPVDGSSDSTFAPQRPDGISKLVAGVVPGGVDFREGGEARPSSDTLPLYRHPADKNAAATAVDVGRRLDVKG